MFVKKYYHDNGYCDHLDIIPLHTLNILKVSNKNICYIRKKTFKNQKFSYFNILIILNFRLFITSLQVSIVLIKIRNYVYSLAILVRKCIIVVIVLTGC